MKTFTIVKNEKLERIKAKSAMDICENDIIYLSMEENGQLIWLSPEYNKWISICRNKTLSELGI
jgi:hypothetical protein